MNRREVMTIGGFWIVAMAIICLLFSACPVPVFGQAPPVMKETTSQAILSDSLPNKGITVTLFFTPGDPRAQAIERFVAKVVADHPQFAKIQLRKVDTTGEPDTASQVGEAPLLVMSVCHADGVIVPANVASGDELGSPAAVAKFFAAGLNTINYNYRPHATPHSRVHDVTPEAIDSIVRQSDEHRAVVLYYNSQSFLSILYRKLFDAASVGKHSAECTWLACGINRHSGYAPALDEMPSLVVYEEHPQGERADTITESKPLSGFGTLSRIDTWLAGFGFLPPGPDSQ